MTTCPCRTPSGPDLDYDACCGPFIRGSELPATAEQLMRSRYTAYTRQNANYLVATTKPSRRDRNELKVITKSFRGIAWSGLEILGTEKGGAGDSEGFVEFKATCVAAGEPRMVHERSVFLKENGRWFYDDGEIMNVAADQEAAPAVEQSVNNLPA